MLEQRDKKVDNKYDVNPTYYYVFLYLYMMYKLMNYLCMKTCDIFIINRQIFIILTSPSARYLIHF